MDFIDRIKQISEQISKLRDQIQTEEATKNAFIMPLLSALGYDVFNSSELKSTASNLMYTKEIKRIMSEQLLEPSPEFVKFFVSQVYSGKIMSGVIDKFTKITKDSINQLISDRITDTLRSVIEREVEDRSEHIVKIQSPIIDSIKAEDTIVTTEEELEGFFIIKSLLREAVEPNRIQYKDTQKYFGVCLDGKPAKTLCRLWFNSKQKYIGFLDDSGKEIKQPIDDLNNLYKFSSELQASLIRVMPTNSENN